MGTEVFPKIDNNVRKFETFQNIASVYKSEMNGSSILFDDNSRSPFSKFMIQLSDETYKHCSQLQNEAQKMCQYNVRNFLRELNIEFLFNFTSNFPDLQQCTFDHTIVLQ